MLSRNYGGVSQCFVLLYLRYSFAFIVTTNFVYLLKLRKCVLAEERSCNLVGYAAT